ncbi:MAG: hypothetical protein JWM56_609 [Candidatus Peribacteria bacterium]|nr:hypothetical protein [Candidatus Peribacteria bacterium]
MEHDPRMPNAPSVHPSLRYSVHVVCDTPRTNKEDSEDRAEVLTDAHNLHLLVADGATGLGTIRVEHKAPGWFAAEWLAQTFRNDACSSSPREIIQKANRSMREYLLALVRQGTFTEQEMTDLCSAVCVAAHIDKTKNLLRFAATKADCWLLVERGGTFHWLTTYPPKDMDYGPIKAAVDAERAGAIPSVMGSLNHPAVQPSVLNGRRDANNPDGTGNGRINGAPPALLDLYIEDNESAPFPLQPGDKIYAGSDGLLPLMSREIYDIEDAATGAWTGREEQRRFVEQAILAGGKDELLKRIKQREKEDPAAVRYPHIKEKTGDDQALIEIIVHEAAGPHLPAAMRNTVRAELTASVQKEPETGI